jgi:2-polyprenyl-3-methyl-5-hydroxy-6-metoxy-1,4-benzoquinol methylase
VKHHTYLWPVIRDLLIDCVPGELLDAGCGYGFISNELSSLGYHVIGIDSAPERIRAGRSAFPHIHFEPLSVYDNLCNLAPRGGWDVILSCEVIEHLLSPRTFLKNMLQNLSPNGKLILTTPYHGYLKNIAISLSGKWDSHHTANCEGGHVKFFSTRTLSELLTDNGFGDLRFHGVGRAPLIWKSMVCEARKAVCDPSSNASS